MREKTILTLIIILGIFFRFYHIEFGLPHSFHADEPEIIEPAIKYTYELKSIVSNTDYYKLIPISFVYGTVPTYLCTALTMLFSKSLNILGIGFEKWHIYVFLRSFNALASLAVVLGSFTIYKKLFKDSFGALIAALLASLSWIFIVHAHYVNADLIQTVFITLATVTTVNYYLKNADTKYTLLTGIFLGAALGTKITTLVSIPVYLLIWAWKRDWRGMLAVILIILGTFILTNPFSLILADSFIFRIYTMVTKEGGMVFDSVDSNPFKYLAAIVFIMTPLPIAFSLYGKYKAVSKSEFPLHVLLIFHVVIYIVFFSLQARRVDRWLLPVLPVLFIYAAHGMSGLKDMLNKYWFGSMCLVFIGTYLYLPLLTLIQFSRYTPKAQAYLWLQQNTDANNPLVRTLAYTEEGLDPLNKLPFADVSKVPVYTGENAQYFLPADPTQYQYVVLASKPMQYYKKQEIKSAYPLYVDRWEEFEQTVLDTSKFRLLKEYVLPKPNILNLSDVYIYENLKTKDSL